MTFHSTEMQSPQNVQAEQSLLGAILVQNDAMSIVRGIVEPEHFYEPLHRQIFQICCEMIGAGKEANPITLKPFLADENIQDISVSQYLIRLCSEAINIVSAPDFAEAIREEYLLRRGLGALQNGIDAIVNRRVEQGAIHILSNARREISAILDIEEDRGSSESQIDEAIESVLQQSADANAGKKVQGIDVDFEPVKILTGDWSAGQLIILGGNTKAGKSALAMQCAFGAGKSSPVWVYSGEMSKDEIIRREIARVCRISARRQKQGKFSQSEYSEIVTAARSHVAKSNVTIQDRPLNILQIEERFKRMTDRYGQCLAVIDYVALVARDKESYRMQKFEFCEYITDRLKRLARRTGSPILALSQLKKNALDNREANSFSTKLNATLTKKPRYSDLYGGVERDADHVLIPHNVMPLLTQIEPMKGSEDYYKWEDAVAKAKGRAEILLALSREAHFPQSVDVGWEGEITSFVDLHVDTLGRGMF